VEPFFIECRADKDVIIQRLSQREHDPQRISDANVAIYLSQAKGFDPLDEIPPAWHEVVDTTGDMGAILLKIERRIYASQC
jgi:predicted kinase